MQQIHIEATRDGRVVLNTAFLKRLRQKRGLSQDALALLCLERHLCLSLASIKRAEAGKSVSYRTARHLAGIFQTELDLLIAPSIAANANLEASPVLSRYENTHTVCAPTLDRRRVLPAVSVIYFALNRDDFDASAQQQVLESGARTIANSDGTELAIVFGAPAHRFSDALAALRCAIHLRSCAATRASLILRRRAIADVFSHTAINTASVTVNANNARLDRCIYLETDLAKQLSTLAQFEARDIPLPGCKRFLRLKEVPTDSRQTGVVI